MADKRADERGQPILPISPPVCHRPQPAGHSPDSLPANTLISTQSNTAATHLAMRLTRAIYPAPSLLQGVMRTRAIEVVYFRCSDIAEILIRATGGQPTSIACALGATRQMTWSALLECVGCPPGIRTPIC